MDNLSASELWVNSRRGKITASVYSPIMDIAKRPMTEEELAAAKQLKSKATTIEDMSLLTVGAMTYLDGIIAEILTGESRRQVTSYAIEWGNQNEPIAMEAIRNSGRFDNLIYYGSINPKFFKYSDLAGGSPDGVNISKTDGKPTVFEVKCPENSVNHIKATRLKNGADLQNFNKEYYNQLQFNMLCVSLDCGIPYSQTKGVFASFDPRMLYESLQLVMVEVMPDMDWLSAIGKAIAKSEQYIVNELIRLCGNDFE